MTGHTDPRQAAIAEAEMATWLAYPNELGAQPDEIELLRTVEFDTPNGPVDLFVFRFLIHEPHWAAENGWMIGVAGPYLRSLQPTTRGLGYTFSKLDREDAMPIVDHVNGLLEIVARFAESRRDAGASGGS
jgi:hypothetical protein